MPSVVEKLQQSSRDLLDTSGRNRLINTPRGQSRSTSVEIANGNADAVYKRLVIDRGSMTFVAGRGEDLEFKNAQSQDVQSWAEPEPGEPPRSSRGDGLQTRMTSEVLQRRLLRLYSDARTLEEETGVNILFLAIGFLKWFEADSSDQPRYAPLLLVPVRLDRLNARSKFKLTGLEEDLNTNLSLRERLKEFGVALPELPDVDSDELVPTEYFARISEAVEGQNRWEVLPNDMVLWFFSFTKFLMYRDLQASSWPAESSIAEHDSICSLLDSGFRRDPDFCGEDDPVDATVPPDQAVHIVDADSSQTLAIEEVGRGHNLVIQGPPGTGKSQTIANIIASAVQSGKRVLFVAEKLAALEVVKGRLNQCGLGQMCLELHSNKANKKAVLRELSDTLDGPRSIARNVESQAEQHREKRELLNRHASALHQPFGKTGLTPYQLIGRLVGLQGKGVRTARCRLQTATSWTQQQIGTKAAMVQDLVLHLERVGIPNEHPWQGVNVPSMLPADKECLLENLAAIRKRLIRVLTATATLVKALLPSQQLHPSATNVAALAKLARHLAQAPDMDPDAIADNIWLEGRNQITELLQSGQTFVAQKAKLATSVETTAWNADVAPARKQLSLRGKSWFRWLDRGYREAIRTLETVCIDRPPGSQEERLALLDELLIGQRARRHLLDDDAAAQIGRRAFGRYWLGPDSDWSKLQAILIWVLTAEQNQLPPTVRHLVAKSRAFPECGSLVTTIASELKPALQGLQAAFRELSLNLQEVFGNSDLNSISLLAVKQRFDLWLANASSLDHWIAFHIRWRRLPAEQMPDLATRLTSGEIAPSAAVDQFYLATYSEILRAVYQAHPELAEFDGMSHGQIIKEFRELDRQRIQLARKQVAATHYRSIPRDDGIGELAVIRREIQKQRRHLPIRQLIRKAGRAIQTIKPVFMMSPVSIAQYLEPGAVSFDLLLIDEASQVRPVDALGAIARCKQIVVVGDDKQLPPTSFFDRLTGNSESEDEESDDANTADLESVLGLCLARNIKPRMLRWHYRSRHHSLIAVSNREFYQDRLFIVPSPDHKPDRLGLHFCHIADGVFGRGGSKTNAKEAQAIAQAAIDHARKNPELTLGIGTFSGSQRDAIEDELELLRRENPDVEEFFSTANDEPFFIKNLESLQGDERDVIFISVGYGPDASGYFGMNFGPLSNSGGERRLNVLISRARHRCEVFSSITADDIDLARARSRGAAALKTFLRYAEKGDLDVAVRSEREMDSEFEVEVKRRLEEYGLEVHPQVGVAGFFIDLAVVDTERPGRYLLGIECDGAAYHSSRSARDRDRLREQVLVDRGWTIHRIWSTDWFKNPDEQLRKTLLAIEEAKMAVGRSTHERTPADNSCINQDSEADGEEFDDREEAESLSFQRAAIPYREAHLRADVRVPLDQVPVAALGTVVSSVVQVEGPIHPEEVVRRVASYWGVQRITLRTTATVQAALDYAQGCGWLEERSGFYGPRGQSQIPIRSRELVTSATLKNPEMVSPEEFRQAVFQIVSNCLGAGSDEVAKAASKLLGLGNAGKRIRDAISRVVDEMCSAGILRECESRLYVG
jgi:very-short-patch-repair endonuclease